MNVSNNLMSGVINMNSIRAQQATKQVIQKVQNDSAAALQEISEKNSISSHMASKAFSVSISAAGVQKSAGHS